LEVEESLQRATASSLAFVVSMTLGASVVIKITVMTAFFQIVMHHGGLYVSAGF
jgi:hypothetical protein